MRKILMPAVLLAVFALAASPALAAPKQFSWSAKNVVTSPSSPGGCTAFDPNNPTPGGTDATTGCPTGLGDWVDAGGSHVIIDPTGGAGGVPRLINGVIKSQLFNAFNCKDTSNWDTGPQIPGCTVELQTDTISAFETGGVVDASSVTPGGDLGGFIVTFPDTNPDFIGGRGIYCHAYCDPNATGQGGVCSQSDIDRIEGDGGSNPGYCAGPILSLTQDAWDFDAPSITVKSPVNPGAWHFDSTYDNFVIPTPWKYFYLGGDENSGLGLLVYGFYYDTNGSAPQYPVPLAPIGGLALGVTMAYMGLTSLRRKD